MVKFVSTFLCFHLFFRCWFVVVFLLIICYFELFTIVWFSDVGFGIMGQTDKLVNLFNGLF